MSKIFVIFTGGTIASTVNSGVIDADETKPYELIEQYKKFDNTIEFETALPYFILSENLSGEHITKLVAKVKENINNGFDGMIITTGTDTLQYCAAAVSVALNNCNLPVILVSSNYPLENPKANGFDNFCGAVEYIKNNKQNGVFVAYKNAGESLKFHSPEKLLDYDCFSDKLRSIDGEISIKNTNLKLLNLGKKSFVLRLKVYPGMVYPTLENEKCVVIDTYHSGTLKTDDNEFFSFVKQAENEGITVVLTGVNQKHLYSSAKDLVKTSNVVLSPYAPIYTYMKIWFLVENDLNISENL